MKRHTNVSQLHLRKCIDQRSHYEGSFELSELSRLCEALSDDRGKVVFELRFGIDEEGYAYLEGQCGSDVSLTCERCLKPMKLHISCDFTVGIVYSDEQAKHLPKRYEPIIIDGETFDARDVLEDELILSLPMYAMHDDTGCAGAALDAKPSETQKPDTQKENPFSVLAQLKK